MAVDLTSQFGGDPCVMLCLPHERLTNKNAQMGGKGKIEELFYRTDYMKYHVDKTDDKSYRNCGFAVGHPGMAILRANC